MDPSRWVACKGTHPVGSECEEGEEKDVDGECGIFALAKDLDERDCHDLIEQAACRD